jgi:hypothetical protein
VVVILAITALWIGGMIAFSVLAVQHFDQRCHDRGGHATTVGRGELCLSRDGRVLDSR